VAKRETCFWVPFTYKKEVLVVPNKYAEGAKESQNLNAGQFYFYYFGYRAPSLVIARILAEGHYRRANGRLR
jgi:hypothetical protein